MIRHDAGPIDRQGKAADRTREWGEYGDRSPGYALCAHPGDEIQLNPQRRRMGKWVMLIGAIILFVGLLGFSLIADFLPVSLLLPSSDPHTYYRIVPTGAESFLASSLLAATGSLLCVTGFVIHRRRKPD